MKVTWLIDTNVFEGDEQVDVLREEIESRGSKIIDWDFKKSIYQLEGYSESLKRKDGPMIPYGSINMIKWTTGMLNIFKWCEWDNLTCTSYLSHLSPYSIHHNYAYLTFGELQHKAEFVCDTFSDGYVVFIRPNDNDKPFHGEVVHVNNYQDWWEEHDKAWKIDHETLCMVSTPSKLTDECRLWFAGGNYIAGSSYGFEDIHILGGRTQKTTIRSKRLEDGYVPDELVKFADDALCETSFYPFPLFTVDLCLTNDGEPHIMEIGSVNCAGLYKADVVPIVEEMEKQAVLEWEDLYG